MAKQMVDYTKNQILVQFGQRHACAGQPALAVDLAIVGLRVYLYGWAAFLATRKAVQLVFSFFDSSLLFPLFQVGEDARFCLRVEIAALPDRLFQARRAVPGAGLNGKSKVKDGLDGIQEGTMIIIIMLSAINANRVLGNTQVEIQKDLEKPELGPENQQGR